MERTDIAGGPARSARNVARNVAAPADEPATSGLDSLRRGVDENAWVRWRRAHTTRSLISLAAALAVTLALVRIPFERSASGFDRYVAPALEQISLEALQTIQIVKAEPPAPRAEATALAAPADELSPWWSEITLPDLPEGEPAAVEAPPPVERLEPVEVEVVQTLSLERRNVALPSVVAGPPGVDRAPQLQALTIDVEYPRDAQRKAIEGRVVLNFVVEPDGRAYAIEVVESLFPSCDLAAVRAVRAARFIPGYYRGKAVPALSTLAIRFMLEG